MTGATSIPAEPTLRGLTERDWPDVRRVDELAFAGSPPEEVWEAERTTIEFDRSVGAYADGRLVGVASVYSLEMTVPGGPRPVAGVTWVSVLPTHRRRGVLSAMMRHQLHELHDSGREPVAALWASEAGIYGRFGYGMAIPTLDLTVPRGATALRPVPVDPTLRLRVVSPEESLDLVQPVYDAAAAQRPGMPARKEERWLRRSIADHESMRKGASPLRVVVAEDDGGVRGYARYATEAKWEDVGPRGVVRVREMFAADPAAYAAVWRFLADQDLTSTVEVWNRPLDDPLLHLLVDVRHAAPRTRDGVYVRVVDVDRALAARTYAVPVDVVVEVTDELCPWNAGRWHLDAGPDGAACTRTDETADLSLSTTELGAAYLGGTSLVALAGAGRVTEHRGGAVATAAAAFRHDPLPWCPVIF